LLRRQLVLEFLIIQRVLQVVRVVLKPILGIDALAVGFIFCFVLSASGDHALNVLLERGVPCSKKTIVDCL
jgi:hypothetical protein